MNKSEVFNEGYQKGLRTVLSLLKEQIEPMNYTKLSEIYSWIDDLILPSSRKKQAEVQNSGEFDDDEAFQDWLSRLGDPYVYGRYKLFDSYSKDPVEQGLLNDDIVESNGDGETTYDAEQDCLYLALKDGGLYQMDEFMSHWGSSEVDYNGNRTFFNVSLFNANEGEIFVFEKLEFVLK